GHPPLFAGGVTAYEIAKDRRTQDVFRVYRSEHEGEVDGVEWSRARVPPPITREQMKENEEREKLKKRKEKERKKIKDRQRREALEREREAAQADDEALEEAMADNRLKHSVGGNGVRGLTDAQLRARVLDMAYASAGSWGAPKPERPVSPNTQRAIDRELRFQATMKRQQQPAAPAPATPATPAPATRSAAGCTHCNKPLHGIVPFEQFDWQCSIALCAMASRVAHAHTQLYNVAIGTTSYDHDKYIQPVVGPRLSPVADFTTKAIRCRNVDGTSPNTPFLSVTAGNQFSVVWHHHNDTAQDNVVSPSHRGPCMIYLSKVLDNPDDMKWFKIYELGFNKDTNKWCSDVARDNHGRVDIVIPKDIEDGKYLLRTDLLALHDAAVRMGAQFYPNCVQLDITGSNNKFLNPPPEYVSFPGAYKPDDKGILYNRRVDKGLTYVIPGPAVYPPVKA
ncbi:hypothetical protein FBU31_001309, partial [Coemansia sp. 'formosensis']